MSEAPKLMVFLTSDDLIVMQIVTADDKIMNTIALNQEQALQHASTVQTLAEKIKTNETRRRN